MDAIELKAVEFRWPETAMLFDLTVQTGELMVLTGPSGSGKSTLLNLIAGFETPDSGRIVLGGKDCASLPPSQRPVSMLFQDHNLFSHLSVEANAGFGIGPRLKFNDADQASIANAINRVGLSGKEKRLPHELSGGERQRAAFARTLLQDRPILLLDEPFASLGPSLRTGMMALLQDLQRERPRTILAVTHHPNEWRGIADGFVFVERGKVAWQGGMDALDGQDSPATLRAYLGLHEGFGVQKG
jgi:thiamine transport system ATP-binding protein